MNDTLGTMEQRVLNYLANQARGSSILAWRTTREIHRGVVLERNAKTMAAVKRALETLLVRGLVVQRLDSSDDNVMLWANAVELQAALERDRMRREQEERARASEREHARQSPPRGKTTSRPAPVMARLANILGMLGSQYDGEVLAAARQAETIRKKLGVQWRDLLAA